MTPQQKADRLCMDMLLQIECNCQPSICKMVAKQCALIAVQYIITSNPHSNPLNTDVYSTMKYWEEVKQEIQKL